MSVSAVKKQKQKMNESCAGFAILLSTRGGSASEQQIADHFQRWAGSAPLRWDAPPLSFSLFLLRRQQQPPSFAAATATVVAEDISGQSGGFAKAEFGRSAGVALRLSKDVLGARSLLFARLGDGSVFAATTGPAAATATPQQSAPWCECPACGGSVCVTLQAADGNGLIVDVQQASPDALSAWLNRAADRPLSPPPQPPQLQATAEDLAMAAETIAQLEASVHRTVIPLLHGDAVTVLFSGGLDSTVLAAVLARVLPPSVAIELVNVAFFAEGGSADSAPDRTAGRASVVDLQRIYPGRRWTFHATDVTEAEARAAMPAVLATCHPACTYMDVTISLALWFACGTVADGRVVALGQGADEQFGGYARYRGAFGRGGWDALRREMDRDLDRLWLRNLGRDDRLLRARGAIPALPFLDREFCRFVAQLPLWRVCEMRLPPGTGDKRMLRLAAQSLGLQSCAGLVKHAIQFGSRVAKLIRQEGVSARKKSSCGAERVQVQLGGDDVDD